MTLVRNLPEISHDISSNPNHPQSCTWGKYRPGGARGCRVVGGGHCPTPRCAWGQQVCKHWDITQTFWTRIITRRGLKKKEEEKNNFLAITQKPSHQRDDIIASLLYTLRIKTCCPDIFLMNTLGFVFPT